MKRFLSIYLAFMIVGLLTACHNSDDPEPPQAAEKTLLLFMPWSAGANEPYNSNLYSYFTQNIADIETAIKTQGGLGSNRLMVFISQSPTYAALVEISYKGQQCVRDTLKRYNRYNYTTAYGIASVLNDVKQQAPANNYAMLIGCHGTGWIPKGIYDFYKTRSFGGSEAAYQIELSDLADGIRQAGMHMQFVAFDDCYMAGVEVAYDLKDAADYLIASTSEIMAAGLPYKQIWPCLIASQPNYQGVVDAFYDFYSHYSYPYGTLSVIDCQQIDETARTMRELNSRYTYDNDKNDELQKLDGMAQTIFFDMQSYTDKLCESSADAEQIAQQIRRMVPYAKATAEIYSAYSGAWKVDTFSGITISDPTTNSYVVGRKTMTAWWQATHND